MAICIAAAGIAVAQQQSEPEELPVPEERSVLVDPAPKLEPPQLIDEPTVPEVAQPSGQQHRVLDELLPPPLPFAEQDQPNRPRLAAPAAPNLGAPHLGAPMVEQPMRGPRLAPPQGQPLAPAEVHVGAVVVDAVPVRIKDAEKRYPGAVPTTVKVHAPHNPRRGVVLYPSPQFIEVWVPPFPPRKVDYNRDGSEVELDFGDYEVEVHWRRDGRIEVDYDD